MLLECRREQDVLRDLLGGLTRSAASVLTLTGRPGHAQNSLVRWAACRARAGGVRVLQAQATPAERELRHGVVRQLTTPLNGAGGTLDALNHLLRSARTTPTLVAVEDLQWLDQASLTWLQALLRGLPTHIPLAVVTSSSGDVILPGTECGGPSPQVAVPVRRVAVPALTDRGVATTVLATCGRAGDEEFVAALTTATAGNPAVLHDVLRALKSHGHAPVSARVPDVHALTAGVVGAHAARALDGLPAEVNSVLRALAVCGDLLDFSLVCTLVMSRTIPEDRIRTLLESVGLTVSVGDKVHIRFPVSKARVLEDMETGERADLYARAAELAHRASAGDEDVAHLLLRSPPLGASWVVPVLRRSFAAALRREDHHRAYACLSRALKEPLDAAERTRLTLELAAAEAVAVPEAGDRRLGELVRSADAVPSAVGVRVRAVDLGFARGNSDWARRTAAEALHRATPAERANLVALFWLASMSRDDGEPMVPEVPALPDLPLSPAQAATRAWQLVAAGEGADKARELARIALTDDGRGEALMMPRLAACHALILTDDHDEAGAALDGILATARRSHLRAITSRSLALRAYLHLRSARLDAAERALGAAERALPAASWHPMTLPGLVALRICVSVEAGRLDRARQLAETPLPAGGEEGVWWSSLLVARARVAAEDGQWHEALRLSQESGRRLLRRQWHNPAVLSWRPLAARACLETGDRAETRRLRDEELALADRWGTASARGIARLETARLFDDDPKGAVDRAREAAALLRNSPARLAQLWGLVRQIKAESAQGDSTAAARSLDELSALAPVHPSSRLGTTVEALTAQGTPPSADPAAPPTPVVRPGWGTLSEAEKRTAELAGRGHGNREIAEQLSVSRRTVELRLSNAYRKLRIGGRDELRRLLGAMEGAVTDAA
ncbi:LuxR C-terminal-related transcriptional regulator [Streptomyces sp. NPDC053427]|uniref:helix-turn-helix transcriptional regulator n=1 Tax=Streptomyces sp. NPDC053427 TaxID=3365701 RepID=UPI0037D29AC2